MGYFVCVFVCFLSFMSTWPVIVHPTTNRRAEGAGKSAERSDTVIKKERKQWRVGK